MRGPKLTHLAFTDEIVLFVEANSNQMQIIVEIIDLFVGILVKKLARRKWEYTSLKMSLVI